MYRIDLDRLLNISRINKKGVLKIEICFVPYSTVSYRSDSSSDANSNCCHKSDALSNQMKRLASSTKIGILHINILQENRRIEGPRIKPWEKPTLPRHSCKGLPFVTSQRRLLLKKEEIRLKTSMEIP